MESFAWVTFFVAFMAAGVLVGGVTGLAATVARTLFVVGLLLTISAFLASVWGVGND